MKLRCPMQTQCKPNADKPKANHIPPTRIRARVGLYCVTWNIGFGTLKALISCCLFTFRSFFLWNTCIGFWRNINYHYYIVLSDYYFSSITIVTRRKTRTLVLKRFFQGKTEKDIGFKPTQSAHPHCLNVYLQLQILAALLKLSAVLNICCIHSAAELLSFSI